MIIDFQKKVFARNLNHYLSTTGKQQKEVAKELGVSFSTFNSWCTGSKMPRMDKIQLLADYFNINKSDLIEENNPTQKDEVELSEAAIELLKDPRSKRFLENFRKLSPEDQERLEKIVISFLPPDEESD